MLIIKLDVTKVDKAHLFETQKGAKYLDLVVFENKEPDKYGNTHIVYQGISKEARAKGEKGKILGNGKTMGGGSSAPAKKSDGDAAGDPW